jgi:hypothetical protein
MKKNLHLVKQVACQPVFTPQKGIFGEKNKKTPISGCFTLF